MIIVYFFDYASLCLVPLRLWKVPDCEIAIQIETMQTEWIHLGKDIGPHMTQIDTRRHLIDDALNINRESIHLSVMKKNVFIRNRWWFYYHVILKLNLKYDKFINFYIKTCTSLFMEYIQKSN